MSPFGLISKAILVVLLGIASTGTGAQAQERSSESLRRLNDSVGALIRKVSPSVVQIMVTGFGVMDEEDGDADVPAGRRRAIGSGFVVDAEGYIITNAHVVKDAQRVQILVPRPKDYTVESSLSSRNRLIPARIVGVSDSLDLALLKVETAKLPALKLGAYRRLRQGEMVFAFGSPEGLRNSVTMGIVSNVARQTDPDSSMVYVQTDAAINPGNSGGPLVNVDGEVVGVNTFIMTESGGNEGLGFAIPSILVDVFHRQVKKTGHLRQPEIGLNLQTIHPVMAEGLRLAQDFGVIVSDVVPDGAAAQAGIHIGDILVAIDGKAVESLPFVTFALIARETSEVVKLAILREGKKLTFKVPVSELPDPAEKYGAIADPEKNAVAALGVLGIEIDSRNAATNPDLRFRYGIVVAARAPASMADVPLQVGDVIYAVNGEKVATLEQLKGTLKAVPKGGAVVLQIQREQKITFLSFTLEQNE